MTAPADFKPTWRFTVYRPGGGDAGRIIYPYTAVGFPVTHGVHAFVAGTDGRGIRAQLTPDGDCREMVFSAVGRGLGLPPLTPLQWEYRERDDSGWLPLFFGEIRQGGNVRNPSVEDFVLRGMSQRLKECVLPPNFATPQQAAHLTVRAVIRAVIDSGQLGTPPLVLYDEALCPDLGFDCGAVKDAHQQTPYALLERIVQDGAGLGVKVAFGVRPDRKFFCTRRRDDVATFTPKLIKWQPPVAETVCTAVLWYVAERPDGTWVTHLSRSPQADVCGLRVKRVGVDLNVDAWVPVRLVEGERGNAAPGKPVFSLSAAELGYLTDGLTVKPTERHSSISTPDNPGQTDTLYFSARASHRAERWVVWGSANFGRDVMIFGDGALGATFNVEVDAFNEFKQTLYINAERLRIEAGPAYAVPANYTFAQSHLFEARPERVNAALLDQLATFHYSLPAQEPADIEIDQSQMRPPTGLTGRIRVETYERPVEAWEYRLSGDRGLKMAALTEQAEDPRELARAALIKARDNEAIITGLTSRK